MNEKEFSETSRRWGYEWARYAKRENFAKIVQYVQRGEFGRDFETVTALDATKRDSTLCDTKAWVEWANKNKDLHL